MENTLFRKYKRRSRCEIPGCKRFAAYEISARESRPLLTLCDEHAHQLQADVNRTFSRIYYDLLKEGKPWKEEPPVEEVKEEPVTEEQVAEEPVKKGPGRPPKDPNAPKRVKLPDANVNFTCKYCGQKFPRSEMSVSDFGNHCRACKAAHNNVVLTDL